MLRTLLVVLFGLFCLSPAYADQSAALSRAMEAVRAKNWSDAHSVVRDQNQISRDIVEWHRLRDGQGTADDVLRFLDRNPDWPGLAYLRKQSEASFGDVSTRMQTRFFAYGDAQTPRGVLIQARLLESQDEAGLAQAGLVLAWRTMSMDSNTQAKYLERYSKLLKPHHEARLDYLLWKGWENSANRMLPLVSEGWQKLAKARIGLRAMAAGVDGLIAAVPPDLQGDPGLAYERFRWRARKGRDSSAAELLLERSKAGTLGEASEWAGWRRALARSSMQDGNYQRAYDVSVNHGLEPGKGYAYSDLEWIAGYVALRFLNRPGDAVGHFERFNASVETPISLGRGGYWIGRAYEAMGDSANANAAYAKGGQHQTSFYGLLAAEKAGIPVDAALRGDEKFPDWRKAAYTTSSVHKAAQMLLKAGELSLAERFWVHLSETQDRSGLGQMGQMAQDMKQPHIAVMLGKKMVRRGVTLPGPYYPLHPLAKSELPVPAEMALAIARRESEFDPSVVSGAGARGLMQLMPNTARQVAGALDTVYSHAWLTSKPEYNARLGSAYLAGLGDQFDGNVILVSAGYNAGPGRPVKWMKQRGDPRSNNVDVIDWIEHIPFSETRNYVMRVAESLPVYRARLGKEALPVPFSQEIVGSSVSPLR